MLRPHHALGTFDDNVIRVLWVRPDLHNALTARGLHAKGPYLRCVVRPVLPLLGVEPHSLRNRLAASTARNVVGHLKPHDETGLLLLLCLQLPRTLYFVVSPQAPVFVPIVVGWIVVPIRPNGCEGRHGA